MASSVLTAKPEPALMEVPGAVRPVWASLGSVLALPAMKGANQFMFQAGKPLVVMNSHGEVEDSGPVLVEADIEHVIFPLLTAATKTAFATKPSVAANLKIVGQGTFELKVVREAAGIKAMLRRTGGDPILPAASPNSVVSAAKAALATLSVRNGAAPSSIPAPVAVPPALAQSTATPPGTASPAVAQGQAKEIDAYFHRQLEMNASDMHLSTSVVPMVRKDGDMAPMRETDKPLTAKDTERLLWELMPEKNREEFRHRHDTDFAYEFGADARFRCNIFLDRKGMGAVFRVIPSQILTAETLGLSKDILKLCYLTKGLVLVTGPTGSGKSTTLCAMVDYINRNRSDHIITIEDPIEFVHENKRCLINQREVHSHTSSFKDALRAALREDPDIILVGEMRDLETVAIAIETAETGHLVFGTLHTSTAPSTVDRIIDQFPAERQAQIRVMLSESLKGVIAQTLCKRIGGGRIPAIEVLMCDGAIANLIREAKTTQIPSSMQIGKAKGNVNLNDALMDLVMKKIVEPQEAYLKAVDKVNFKTMLKRENINLVLGGAV